MVVSREGGLGPDAVPSLCIACLCNAGDLFFTELMFLAKNNIGLYIAQMGYRALGATDIGSGDAYLP